MAATTQIVAALVSPTTAPRAWRIVPAPMKPTPVTIWPATRVASVAPCTIVSDSCVYRAEPMQIRMLVRRPAGLPPSSRRPAAWRGPAGAAARAGRCRSRGPSSGLRGLEESHPLAYLGDGAAGQRPRLRGAGAQPLGEGRPIAPDRIRPLADGGERGYHIVRQHPLAVEAAPAGGPALVRHIRLGLGRREALVNRENVADVGVARILARHAGGIGRGGPQLLPDRLRRVEQ